MNTGTLLNLNVTFYQILVLKPKPGSIIIGIGPSLLLLTLNLVPKVLI